MPRHESDMRTRFALGLARLRRARTHARRAVRARRGRGAADRRSGVAEVVIPPRSAPSGTSAFPGMVTESGDLVVLAVQRKGEDCPARPCSRSATRCCSRERGRRSRTASTIPEVLVVDQPDLIRRQRCRSARAPSGRSSSSGRWSCSSRPAPCRRLSPACSLPVRSSSAACSRSRQAYRSISWTTVMLVAGMISLSTAMTETGAAARLAETGADRRRLGAYALLLGLFVLTAVFGQLISNMATALIVIPVAVSAANDLGVSPRPVLMCVIVSAAAALPHPGRDAGESDGDGAGRVPVRRLLEARPAAARALRGGRRRSRPGVLAVLSVSGERRESSAPRQRRRVPAPLRLGVRFFAAPRGQPRARPRDRRRPARARRDRPRARDRRLPALVARAVAGDLRRVLAALVRSGLGIPHRPALAAGRWCWSRSPSCACGSSSSPRPLRHSSWQRCSRCGRARLRRRHRGRRSWTRCSEGRGPQHSGARAAEATAAIVSVSPHLARPVRVFGRWLLHPRPGRRAVTSCRSG